MPNGTQTERSASLLPCRGRHLSTFLFRSEFFFHSSLSVRKINKGGNNVCAAVRKLINGHESDRDSNCVLQPPDTGSVPGEPGHRLAAEMPAGRPCPLPACKRGSERRNQAEVFGKLREAVFEICRGGMRSICEVTNRATQKTTCL